MAKRISQSAVNWAALAERVPAEQKANLAAFKIKSDTYLRRLVLIDGLHNFRQNVLVI